MVNGAVLVERRDGIAILTLNRPHAMNAIDASMRDDLIAALEAADAAPDVKAIVIAGAGGRAFSAGYDLETSRNLTEATAPAFFQSLHGMYQTVRRFSKPAVAAIDGVATGSGFQIALLCDLRVGGGTARMGQPEVAAGIANVIGVVPMLAALGLSRTLAMSLASRILDAEACRHFGLLTEIAPEGETLERAVAAARRMTELPPIALKLTKARIAEMTGPAFDEALEMAMDFSVRSYAAGEPQAAAAAFLARRQARQ